MTFVVYDVYRTATNPISDTLKNVIIYKHLEINE